MTVAKVKGQIKETTGKVTGDTGMQIEGTIEKGVAEVKKAVGYIADLVGDGINTVTNWKESFYNPSQNDLNEDGRS